MFLFFKELSLLLQDMFSTGQSSPHVDSSRDYHFVMTTGEEGYTIFLKRGANTGDAKDILFMVIVSASLAKFYEESEKLQHMQ